MHMRQRRTRALVLIALLAAGTGVLAYATHLLRRSELQTIDARYSIRGKQKVPGDIVLVPIDNATVQDFRQANRGQFPFRRRYDAEVIDRLRRAGAKTIAVDLEFTQQTDVADDNALIEAIGRAHGKVVLAASEVEPGGRTDVLGGPSLLRELGARAADVRLRKGKEVDTDGVVRRLGYSYNGLRSFPVATAEVFTGRRIAPSLFEAGQPADQLCRAGPKRSPRSPTRRCWRAGSPRARSPARSRSSACRTRSSATSTRRRRPAAARWPVPRSRRTRRTRCCAACRCATRPTCWTCC